MLRALVLAVAILCVQDAGQDANPRVATWLDEMGERITGLMPEPIAGMDRSMPWDVEADHPPVGGCFFGCTQYPRLMKERSFVIAEPELLAKVEAAEKQALDLAMQVASAPTDEKLIARVKSLEERAATLQRSARRIEVAIHLNLSVTETQGPERAGAPAGTIGGHPVYRFAFDDPSYEPIPAHVRLAVGLGPASLPNPKVDPSKMQTVVKTIVVSAAVQSRRDTVKADEALIRKLLETVKYDELATFLK